MSEGLPILTTFMTKPFQVSSKTIFDPSYPAPAAPKKGAAKFCQALVPGINVNMKVNPTPTNRNIVTTKKGK